MFHEQRSVAVDSTTGREKKCSAEICMYTDFFLFIISFWQDDSLHGIGFGLKAVSNLEIKAYRRTGQVL